MVEGKRKTQVPKIVENTFAEIYLMPLQFVNPLSANFTKWSNTQTIRRSVFDHFVGLTLKGLRYARYRKQNSLWC